MANLSDRTWSEILAAFCAQHPELYRPWFDKLEPLTFQHGVIRVRTTRSDQYQYLTQQCQQALGQAAQAVIGRLVWLLCARERPLRMPCWIGCF